MAQFVRFNPAKLGIDSLSSLWGIIPNKSIVVPAAEDELLELLDELCELLE